MQPKQKKKSVISSFFGTRDDRQTNRAGYQLALVRYPNACSGLIRSASHLAKLFILS